MFTIVVDGTRTPDVTWLTFGSVAVDPRDTRDRIEVAINWLNSDLRRDPNSVGESRPNNRRIAFAGPLVSVFRVNEATSTVRVNHVWRYGR